MVADRPSRSVGSVRDRASREDVAIALALPSGCAASQASSMIPHPALFAAALVVAASAAGSGDYEMIARWDGSEVHVKAKSRVACEKAVAAIRLGWYRAAPSYAELTCVPHPGYFTPRENCIPGYRGPRRNGVCR
jgi:hypothetical protein